MLPTALRVTRVLVDSDNLRAEVCDIAQAAVKSWLRAALRWEMPATIEQNTLGSSRRLHTLFDTPPARVRFHVDSLLVAKQVNCQWRCLSTEIRQSYEALSLLAQLRGTSGVLEVVVLHVYREFNSDADGVCNCVLDSAAAGVPADARGWLVEVNWEPFR